MKPLKFILFTVLSLTRFFAYSQDPEKLYVIPENPTENDLVKVHIIVEFGHENNN